MTDEQQWIYSRTLWFGYTLAGLCVGLFNGVWWAFFIGAVCTILAHIAWLAEH